MGQQLGNFIFLPTFQRDRSDVPYHASRGTFSSLPFRWSSTKVLVVRSSLPLQTLDYFRSLTLSPLLLTLSLSLSPSPHSLSLFPTSPIRHLDFRNLPFTATTATAATACRSSIPSILSSFSVVSRASLHKVLQIRHSRGLTLSVAPSLPHAKLWHRHTRIAKLWHSSRRSRDRCGIDITSSPNLPSPWWTSLFFARLGTCDWI